MLLPSALPHDAPSCPYNNRKRPRLTPTTSYRLIQALPRYAHTDNEVLASCRALQAILGYQPQSEHPPFVPAQTRSITTQGRATQPSSLRHEPSPVPPTQLSVRPTRTVRHARYPLLPTTANEKRFEVTARIHPSQAETKTLMRANKRTLNTFLEEEEEEEDDEKEATNRPSPPETQWRSTHTTPNQQQYIIPPSNMPRGLRAADFEALHVHEAPGENDDNIIIHNNHDENDCHPREIAPEPPNPKCKPHHGLPRRIPEEESTAKRPFRLSETLNTEGNPRTGSGRRARRLRFVGSEGRRLSSRLSEVRSIWGREGGRLIKA